MVAQSSSKLGLTEDKGLTRFGPSVKRRPMSRPRKRLNCGKGRDFFRLAAEFANAEKRNSDFDRHVVKVPSETLIDLASSPYLQAQYQERGALFVGLTALSANESTKCGSGIFDKWLRAVGRQEPTIEALLAHHNETERHVYASLCHEPVVKNGVHFSARESSYLLMTAVRELVRVFLSTKDALTVSPLSAIDFHRRLTISLAEDKQRSFFMVAHGNDAKKFLVDRARLFWSHRLREKALQASNSAEPSICYFHAALRSGTGPGIDILYWLKLNDEKEALAGDFISIGNEAITPYDLFLPETLLFDAERRTTCLAALDPPTRLFIADIAQLFVH